MQHQPGGWSKGDLCWVSDAQAGYVEGAIHEKEGDRHVAVSLRGRLVTVDLLAPLQPLKRGANSEPPRLLPRAQLMRGGVDNMDDLPVLNEVDDLPPRILVNIDRSSF